MIPHTSTPALAHKSNGLQGVLDLPGDKSISHRSMLFGLLSRGRTEITNMLEGEDVIATANAARAMGAKVERLGNGHWIVDGPGLGALLQPAEALDFGNAGTGVRLAMGVIAGHQMSAQLTGDASLSKRPMGRVLDPLAQMGARVEPAGHSKLPLTLTGTANPIPIRYELPVPSAQVKSAILLAGLNSPGDTTIVEPVPTRDHTERMLKAFGAAISVTQLANGTTEITLKGRPSLTGQQVEVPGDPSSAAFAMVAALIVPGSDVLIKNMMLNPNRTGLLTTLLEMGGDLSVESERSAGGERVGDVRVRSSSLRGVDVPAERAPSMIDEYPILAVAASFAGGITRMTGLHELTVKESDRLAATAQGLFENGVKFEKGDDWLHVEGGDVVGGGAVETHLDHRLAMSFLVMGMASKKPVTVDDSTIIETSYPAFVPDMRNLGAMIEVRS